MKSVWTSVAALLGLCVSGPAMAQSVSAEEVDSADNEEIVVTVQKRTQVLRDVPINVNVVTESFRNTYDLFNLDDLSRYTPGFLVQEQSPNNVGFVVRGITSDSGESNIEPRVAVFYDGAPASRNRGSYVELFDLERVEVVKGPQATLFGRSALIGGVNVISKKANLSEFEAQASVLLGDFDSFRTEVVANIPFVQDKLAARIAYTRREREGFVENLTDGERLGTVEVDSLRVSIGFAPTQNLRFDVSAGIHSDENSGTPFKSGTFAPPGGDTSPFTAAALNTFSTPGLPTIENGADLGLDRVVRFATLLGEWRATDAFTVSSISSYRWFDSVEVFDPDGSSLPLLLFAEDAEGLQWSQEFRVNWDKGGKLKWFGGVSLFHEDGNQRVPLQFNEQLTLGLLTGTIARPAPQSLAFLTSAPVVQGQLAALGVPATLLSTIAAGLSPAHTEQFTNFSRTTAFDVYADVSYAITPRLTLTAGGRFTYEDKRTGASSELFGAGSTLGAVLNGAAGIGAELAGVNQFGLFFNPTVAGGQFQNNEFDGFAWRFVAEYALNDTANLYGSYARGRRSNVVNGASPGAPFGPVGFSVLPEETVDSFEVGYKSSLLGNRLSLDGSVFYYLYENFLTTDTVNGVIVPLNAGAARAVGFEGQAFFRPIRGVELFATYGFNRARLTTGARDGNQFRLSPDHKLAVGATFSQSFDGVGEFSLSPSYTYQSRIFFDDDNDRTDLQQGRVSPAFNDFVVDEVQQGYGLVNIRAAWTSPGDRFRFGLFANNLADREFIIDAGNTGDGFGIPTFIRGARRTVGVELSARY